MHGDLTTSNIMITDDTRQVKLASFDQSLTIDNSFIIKRCIGSSN